MIIIKLSEPGDFSWAGLIDGPAYFSSSAISTDTDKNVYITGGFRITADFDPSPVDTFSFTSFSHWVTDAYTLKWSQENTTVGIREYDNTDLMLFPNPAADRVIINARQNHINKMHLTNVLGQQINTSPINRNQQIELDLSNCQNGIYLVEIELTDGGKEVRRLVIQR